MAERAPAIVLGVDEPVTRTAVRRLLERAGFEVRPDQMASEAGKR